MSGDPLDFAMLDRASGVLLGQACGDALGVPCEGAIPGSYKNRNEVSAACRSARGSFVVSAKEDMTMRAKKIATSISRVLFGLAFCITGLDGFLHFLPQPTTPPPEGAMAFALALMKSGYMFPLIKGTELVAGALLLSNRFVPLALVLLAPVLVNIVAFHAFLAPDGLAIAVALVALEMALAWAYRAAYRPLLAARISGAPARSR